MGNTIVVHVVARQTAPLDTYGYGCKRRDNAAAIEAKHTARLCERTAVKTKKMVTTGQRQGNCLGWKGQRGCQNKAHAAADQTDDSADEVSLTRPRRTSWRCRSRPDMPLPDLGGCERLLLYADQPATAVQNVFAPPPQQRSSRVRTTSTDRNTRRYRYGV